MWGINGNTAFFGIFWGMALFVSSTSIAGSKLLKKLGPPSLAQIAKNYCEEESQNRSFLHKFDRDHLLEIDQQLKSINSIASIPLELRETQILAGIQSNDFAGMGNEFINSQHSFEMEQKYSYVDPFRRAEHEAERRSWLMQRTSDALLNSVGNLHGKRFEKWGNALLKREKYLQAPAAIIGFATTLYNGRPIPIRLPLEFFVETRLSLKDQNGGISLEHPILGRWSLDFKPLLPTQISEACYNAESKSCGDEHVVFSGSRRIPLVDLDAKIRVGGASQLVSAGLSKQINPNISTHVDVVRFNQSHRHEGYFRVQYNLAF